MVNKKFNLMLITVIIFTSFCVTSFVPAYAKKGSSKGKDVWWIKHVDENTDQYWKAIIYKTKSGIVHEWRYECDGEPIDVHLTYRLVETFPRGHSSRKWIRWTFDDRYEDISGDEGDLKDYLTRYSEYWVHINHKQF